LRTVADFAGLLRSVADCCGTVAECSELLRCGDGLLRTRDCCCFGTVGELLRNVSELFRTFANLVLSGSLAGRLMRRRGHSGPRGSLPAADTLTFENTMIPAASRLPDAFVGCSSYIMSQGWSVPHTAGARLAVCGTERRGTSPSRLAVEQHRPAMPRHSDAGCPHHPSYRRWKQLRTT
jgi:hypothetical protein